MKTLRGQAFNDDAETLYSLPVQYFGTSGTGSNTVSCNTSSNNGRKFYIELKVIFKTEAYEDTKYSKANDILQSAHYYENVKFTLDFY